MLVLELFNFPLTIPNLYDNLITMAQFSFFDMENQFEKLREINDFLFCLNEMINWDIFKLFVLEFAFTFACLAFGRQALTLLNR
jgi:hypothetical protein